METWKFTDETSEILRDLGEIWERIDFFELGNHHGNIHPFLIQYPGGG